MKKIIPVLAGIVMYSAAVASAAPIQDLHRGQTVVGGGSDGYYLEHQLTEQISLGYQNADRDRYGHMDDIYAQFKLAPNLRALIGSRDLNTGDDFYLGLAASAPLAPRTTGYASFVSGNDFNEVQAGANFRLIENLNLNINYHSFNPDYGRSEHGLGFGASFTF